jgi:spore germination protein YaaH
VEYQKDGATYRMWQEESTSIEEKMKVIYGADIAGVAEWKLGLETETIWDTIIKYLQ